MSLQIDSNVCDQQFYFVFEINYVFSSLFAVWMYFGLIGGSMFIVIQMILIIDFAHRWAESWVDKVDETGSMWYYCGEYE